MAQEFVYQNNYESTIDTLALRENVKKILINAGVKTVVNDASASKTVESAVVNPELLDMSEQYPVIDATQQPAINDGLKSTLGFLQSESALKLLALTNHARILDSSVCGDVCLEFKLDESQKNIFAA